MKNKKGVIIYWANKYSPSTVYEHVENISIVDNFEIRKINIHGSKIYQIFIGFFRYLYVKNCDLVIFHNTITYSPQSFIINILKRVKFSKNTKKVYMKQDEMLNVNKTKDVVKALKIDLLITCIPPDQIEKVYPISEFPNLKFFHSLTGYISKESLTKYRPKAFEEREIEVFYRGMITPFEWGKLSYEKYFIGEKFLEINKTKNLNLVCDISSNEDDRIYGQKWIDKLCNSKVVLGVESGASIFDFDGSIAIKISKLRTYNPALLFEDVFEEYLKPFESNVNYGQLSPRHLEACMAGAVPLMFEGAYSGFFKADINYILLKRDFSNIEEVYKKIKDNTFLESIVTNNNFDILQNHELSYEYYKLSLKNAITALYCSN